MRHWLKVLLAAWVLLTLVCGGGLFFVYRASQQVPEFYAKAVETPPAVQRGASEAMVQRVTALVSDARHEGEWHALFTEEQINGWLAVDLVENHARSLPAGISDPRIDLAVGNVTLACRAKRGSIDSVVTLSVEPYLAEPNVLGLRIRAVRAGSVPLPMDRVLEAVSDAAGKVEVPLHWLQEEGDPVALVPLEPLLKSKDRQIRVESLRVDDDTLYFTGHTAR